MIFCNIFFIFAFSFLQLKTDEISSRGKTFQQRKVYVTVEDTEMLYKHPRGQNASKGFERVWTAQLIDPRVRTAPRQRDTISIRD